MAMYFAKNELCNAKKICNKYYIIMHMHSSVGVEKLAYKLYAIDAKYIAPLLSCTKLCNKKFGIRLNHSKAYYSSENNVSSLPLPYKEN